MIFKNGYRITQVFGNNPDYYKQFGFAGHEGLDLVPSTPGDTTIYCIEDGEVLRDVDDPKSGAYGQHVVIWNKENKRAWWYCHLASNETSLGQQMKAGQKVGVMGATGNTNGAHLHLNLRTTDANKNVLDPNNGYKGFVNPLPVLQNINTPMADTITIPVSERDFLIGRATTAKEVAQYLEIANPDNASTEDMKRVIGGYKSRSTDLQSQLTTAKAEVDNRTEQVGRLKADLLEKDKLISSLQDSAKPYTERIKNLEGQVKALAKAKGALNTELAQCKNGQLDCFTIFLNNVKKLFNV